jgi:hypothetical protein
MSMLGVSNSRYFCVASLFEKLIRSMEGDLDEARMAYDSLCGELYLNYYCYYCCAWNY